jgi:hypothetical protein
MNGWMDDGGGDSHNFDENRHHITDRTGISEKEEVPEEYEDKSRTFEL